MNRVYSSPKTGGRLYATSRLFDQVCTPKRGVHRRVLEAVIMLAVEIAREGREGRRIGTLFVVGDVAGVMERSKAMILDPLHGHSDEQRRVTNPDARETIKELAQLDGAFLVSDDGVVLSACRYIDATSEGIDLPLGLGSRHMAAASITRKTDAVAVVVSESSFVRVFDNGELVAEIIPELWMLRNYSLHVSGPVHDRAEQDIRVVSKSE
jgi:DNA integrity scanning protein DisA with diadenylate cyclase activity